MTHTEANKYLLTYLIIQQWVDCSRACIIISFIHNLPKFGSPLQLKKNCLLEMIKKMKGPNFPTETTVHEQTA